MQSWLLLVSFWVLLIHLYFQLGSYCIDLPWMSFKNSFKYQKNLKTYFLHFWYEWCLFFFFHLFLLVGGWLLHNISVGFVIHGHELAMELHVFRILIPPPTSLSPDSSGSSQCTSPEHLSHVSHLDWWSVWGMSYNRGICCHWYCLESSVYDDLLYSFTKKYFTVLQWEF